MWDTLSLQRSHKEGGGQRVQPYLELNAEALNRGQVTDALYAYVDREERSNPLGDPLPWPRPRLVVGLLWAFSGLGDGGGT